MNSTPLGFRHSILNIWGGSINKNDPFLCDKSIMGDNNDQTEVSEFMFNVGIMAK